MQEERQRQVEQDLDYLAPFLIQMGGVEKMTKWLALRLKDDCLNDFKHRLVDKANLIQARFEKVPWSLPSLFLDWGAEGGQSKGWLGPFILTSPSEFYPVVGIPSFRPPSLIYSLPFRSCAGKPGASEEAAVVPAEPDQHDLGG